jgi:pimeloyl-ACP methyl ester carboxylesterase
MSLKINRYLFNNFGDISPGLFSRYGLHLWGKTHRRPWKPWESRILQSANRRHVELHNERVAVYHWGQGDRRILMLPGWNSRASHFKNHIEQFDCLGYQVISLDPVGHGNSTGTSTNIAQYLDTIRLIGDIYGNFDAVLGHSFGGLCIPYALNHYHIARKAVLLATPNNLHWLFERFIKIVNAPPGVGEKMQQSVEVLLGENCWQIYSVNEQAKDLQHVPAMILHDDHDSGVPVSQAHDNHQSWPGSRLHITHRLGHQRILSHPSAVKPAIDFIEE